MIEWTLTYILSQVFTVVEYGLLGASYFARNRKAVVLLDIASMACGIVAFLLLGADLGMLMSVIILLANFYYLWEDASSSRITSSASPVRGGSTKSAASLRASKYPRTSSKITTSSLRTSKRSRATSEIFSSLKIKRVIVLILVLTAIAVVTVLTYDGPLSLLSVAATVLYEISIWQKSTKAYKFLGIPVAFCWMAYNGFEKSIFGVLCEMVVLVASIVGYVREVKAGKKKKRGRRK